MAERSKRRYGRMPMRGVVGLFVRWLALVSLAIWFGGFTFYSAVVVPIVGEAYGPVEAGATVTRQVTVYLNGVGVVTLLIWFGLATVERRQGGRGWRWSRLAMLAVNAGLLAWLYVLHSVLAGQLDAEQMTGFYARHEFYLILSTVQWAINLVLIAVSLRIWQAPETRPEESAGATPPR